MYVYILACSDKTYYVGVTNNLEFTANKIGEFPGRCNILCGRSHSQMLFTVKVVSQADYEKYLETLKASTA